jgi:predicted ATP-dependent protease
MAFLALFTRFFDRKMRNDTAVTGVLSLGGAVLAVADINAKIRGAKKAGYKRVVVPTSNYRQVKEALKNDPEVTVLQALDVYELLNHCLIDEHRE